MVTHIKIKIINVVHRVSCFIWMFHFFVVLNQSSWFSVSHSKGRGTIIIGLKWLKSRDVTTTIKTEVLGHY